ncbi:uncharacterized protein BP01DRAFT_305322 [Aspergillus saccharolyticus JOP 1030-1]|uniref:Uncharacterized protein n=1 Tax=Aspergillus saccharolyticus JOP 1030-1 TaxID=1450539 RepID=A0A318Z5G1_9EURO|nr:hypothetical protein BP01DRAFT_305322 [Aspergillus saccharolyticus JOP 1030-1]PYH41587.1 hypothetical protein BP01DRAFT_305322 [Aspergillus saccharolyticus JOP 1030-1]
MPVSSHPPTMNPTVEEVEDESKPSPGSGNSDTAQQPLSWAEVCSQHESLLASHLALLQQVQGEVPSNGDASRLVSNMLERTKKLMMQFKVIKGKFVKNLGAEKISRAGPADLDMTSSHQEGDSSGNDLRAKGRTKRARTECNERESAIPLAAAQAVLPEHPRHHKRKRLIKVQSGDEVDVRNITPVSIETEDISEEVQRRLAIREEQRRKRSTAKVEKRKRDSMTSTGSAASPGAVTRHPRKKMRAMDSA